jgi:hypothetical protein
MMTKFSVAEINTGPSEVQWTIYVAPSKPPFTFDKLKNY